jgi:signal transduction histidine kinase
MGMDYFHTPGTNSERGSGLGLRLAREFIAKNEGKIGLTHNLDKGTTFWILLKCD